MLQGEVNGPLKVLGLPADCSSKDIRSAYRRLAGKWHPDKWLHANTDAQAEARQQFSILQKAYYALDVDGQ